MFDLIRRNLPARKPQLWEHAPRALARRLVLELRSCLSERWLDGTCVVPMLDGSLHIEVVPRDAIGRAIFVYGVYEISLTRFIEHALRPGNTFVDVGANCGYYTILGAKLVGPRGAVHAFEPVEALRHRLERSVALNRLDCVISHDEAVWEGPGVVPFFEANTDTNSGVSSVLPGAERSREARKVRATTLDLVATEVGRIDLVKLDVEGGESAVLRGATGLLSSPSPPILAFESFEVSTVAAYLERFGYEVRALHYSRDRGLEFHPLGEKFENLYADYEAPNFVAAAPRSDRRFWGSPRVGVSGSCEGTS